MGQVIMNARGDYLELLEYITSVGCKKIFLVHGASLEKMTLGRVFTSLPWLMGVTVGHFTEFHPNPDTGDVMRGIEMFRAGDFDMIVAAGGGSAIDVAKAIKLYAGTEPDEDFPQRAPAPADAPFLAIPTTAGTGSEATSFSVIYQNGEKKSLDHEDALPTAVLFDPSTLKNLPLYQRQSTMLDAFCHAVESFWSVNSTEASRALSTEALSLIWEEKDAYLAGGAGADEKMLRAANLAGQAINITRTTAAHAMSYKLTSLFGIPHGHAAALALAVIWPYMMGHIPDCIDPRGQGYLAEIFQKIASALAFRSADEAAAAYRMLLVNWRLFPLVRNVDSETIRTLAASVNLERLKNSPVHLDEAALAALYSAIFA